MAADQQLKHLSRSNLLGYTSREQRRAKKKKLGAIQDDLNIRSSISLNWDGQRRSVVAKREQIGISRRDLASFLDILPHCNSKLADVFVVPQEIFELENLVDILSYSVWQSNLTEHERSMLCQFLPKGVDPDYVVQELLSGDNLFFGNPFLEWGASVCSDGCHPDKVLLREQHVKANRDMYYLSLEKYHNDMIGNVQMWKERWDRCQDPEEEIVQKIWRSKKLPGEGMQLSDHEYEENQVATPESSSLATSERAFCIDNSPSLAVVAGVPKRRKGQSDSKGDNSRDGLNLVIKHKRGEKVQKHNIQHSDGTQYMSYIKVSREQHRRVKSTMKHTSNSTQLRSLNSVLGNLETLHVQPFEIFEEEERQKLHFHWLQLANRDISAGLANWTKRKVEEWQLRQSLGQELEEKLKFQEDEEKEHSHDVSPELPENREVRDSQTSLEEDEDMENSDSLLHDQTTSQVTKIEIAKALKDNEEEKTDGISQEGVHDLTEPIEDEQAVSHSPLRNIVSISSIPEGNDTKLDSCDDHVSDKADGVPHMVSEYTTNLNHEDVAASQRNPRESADDVWSGISVPGPYYHSTNLSHDYVSSNEMSLSHQQVIEDQHVRMINLEMGAQGTDSGRGFLHGPSDDLPFYSSYHPQGQNEVQEKDAGKKELHRQPDDASLFSSYAPQGRNELFDAIFKSQDGLPYHHQQKRAGLDFLQSDSIMMESGQFSGHIRDQVDVSHPFEMRQKRMNDVYMGQNIEESLYSDEGRYCMPKVLPVNVQDWGAGTNRILAAPSQTQLNSGDLVGQNWFHSESQGRGSWSGLEGAVGQNRSIGGENNSEQSIFSVLSECSELRSGGSYDSMCSAERFMQPAGGYSALGGGGIPATSNILPQTANPLNYLSRHEGSGGLRANNLGWTGLSHQNSGLQESMSKPYVGSWNR